MAKKTGSDPASTTARTREERLKAALKANLARRKAQSRQRGQETAADNNTPGDTGQDKDA